MTNEDIDFSQELENYLDQHEYSLPESGDIRKGVIVDVSPEGIIIDLGLKRDGWVPAADLAKLTTEERDSLKVDMEIPVYITNAGESDNLEVSVHRAFLNEDWIKAQELMEKGEIVEAEVVGYNRGGALVDFGRLRGFIPLSQLSDYRPSMKDREKQRVLSKLRGANLPLKIIEVDRRRRRLVMSHRDAQKEWLEGRRNERFTTLTAGDVVTGRVSSLRDFGVFVDIGDGIEGLIHVSELAWYRIEHPGEVLKIGDEFEVFVLKVDENEQRVSLSRKRLLPDPWSNIDDRYKLNQLVEGKITRIVNYGAFVELEPGVEGLLHTSKLTKDDITNPNEVVREGETHLLRVISIDKERQRIGLSLKAVTAKEQIEWMMSQGTETEAPAQPAETVAETTEEAVGEETPAAVEPEVVATSDAVEPEVVATPDAVEPEVVEPEAPSISSPAPIEAETTAPTEETAPAAEEDNEA